MGTIFYTIAILLRFKGFFYEQLAIIFLSVFVFSPNSFSGTKIISTEMFSCLKAQISFTEEEDAYDIRIPKELVQGENPEEIKNTFTELSEIYLISKDSIEAFLKTQKELMFQKMLLQSTLSEFEIKGILDIITVLLKRKIEKV